MSVLRQDLLAGRTIVLAGGVRSAIRDELAGLGASIEVLDPNHGQEWTTPAEMLVYEAAEAFDAGGQAGLEAGLDQAWEATRAVATGALIPAGTGGKVLFLAPPPDRGAYAEAVRAGLENLARTLSTEWARHRVTVTAIAPAPGTTDLQLATLICFLASPAGDYFSGCRFELRG